MKTKCTVIGDTSAGDLKKEITFEFFMDPNVGKLRANTYPKNFENIELLTLNFHQSLDLMFAYDDVRNYGLLYLGKWNDGIVINH